MLHAEGSRAPLWRLSCEHVASMLTQGFLQKTSKAVSEAPFALVFPVSGKRCQEEFPSVAPGVLGNLSWSLCTAVMQNPPVICLALRGVQPSAQRVAFCHVTLNFHILDIQYINGFYKAIYLQKAHVSSVKRVQAFTS